MRVIAYITFTWGTHTFLQFSGLDTPYITTIGSKLLDEQRFDVELNYATLASAFWHQVAGGKISRFLNFDLL